MVRRFFQYLQKGICRLLVRSLEMVDEENAVRTSRWLQLRPLTEKPHLLNRELPKRAVRGERHEIRMRRKEQRIFCALVGRPLLAGFNRLDVFWKAQIVTLNLL